MNKIHILYIEDDPNIAEIYSIMIKEEFENVSITHFLDGFKAVQELKKSPQAYQLIISDYKLPNITGGQIFQFVDGQMLGIPFILLSGFDCTSEPEFSKFFVSYVRNAVLVKPVCAEDLVEKIKWCLASESNLLKIYTKNAVSCDEKTPISSEVFLKLNLVPCDVYLKLNDGKFVKVINNNEIFERALIQKLILKGVNQFFVNRSELSKYSDSIINSLTGIVKARKIKGDEVQKSQLNNKAIDLLRANLTKCGFSDALLEATDELVDLQMQLINSSAELSIFVEKFQLFRKSAADHSRIVNYIMVAILKDLTWDSESTLHRMCVASLLHDVTLTDVFYKKILNDSQIVELSEEDQKLFYRHPDEASHLARNFEKISNGIEQFILEHHELPDGKGFPRKLNFNHIHPLSAVLHISDFVADLLVEYNFEMDKVNKKIIDMKSYYLRGFYRKPYEAILRVFKLNLNKR
jgi:response regulator RpfG family c-di-GMP phosphodiesterase